MPSVPPYPLAPHQRVVRNLPTHVRGPGPACLPRGSVRQMSPMPQIRHASPLPMPPQACRVMTSPPTSLPNLQVPNGVPFRPGVFVQNVPPPPVGSNVFYPGMAQGSNHVSSTSLHPPNLTAPTSAGISPVNMNLHLNPGVSIEPVSIDPNRICRSNIHTQPPKVVKFVPSGSNHMFTSPAAAASPTRSPRRRCSSSCNSHFASRTASSCASSTTSL